MPEPIERELTGLRPKPASVPAVRDLVAEVAALCSPDARADAEMCASELATNCVVHARTRFDVAVRLTDRSLRVALTDGSSRRPRADLDDWKGATGRGLAIVEALADRWGHDLLDRGKVVWFELDLGARPRGDAGLLRASERTGTEAPLAEDRARPSLRQRWRARRRNRRRRRNR